MIDNPLVKFRCPVFEKNSFDGWPFHSSNNEKIEEVEATICAAIIIRLILIKNITIFDHISVLLDNNFFHQMNIGQMENLPPFL